MSNRLLWELVEKILADDLQTAQRNYAQNNATGDYRRALHRFNEFILDGRIPSDLRGIAIEQAPQTHTVLPGPAPRNQYVALSA